MELCLIYYTTDLMNRSFQETGYHPKRWLWGQLNQIEKNILDYRERIRVSLARAHWHLPMQRQLQDLLPDLIDVNIKPFQIPTLKPPAFFKRRLKNNLKLRLSELLKTHERQADIAVILERSRLDLQTPEFYTLPIKSGYIICGNGQPTFGNLICLAHELGHALFELDFSGDELGSEVAAFQMEDDVAQLLLKDSFDQFEWTQYKYKQDQLNYSLCVNEFKEFETGVSKTLKHHLFFRESLVTCWGYQCIYAWASISRGESEKNSKLFK